MTTMDEQKDVFAARLTRISAGGKGTMEEVHVGASEESFYRERAKGDVAVLTPWQDNIKAPLSMAKAFLIGLMAVFVVRLLRFHLMEGGFTGGNADLTMIIDVVAAIALGFVLNLVLRIRNKLYLPALALGTVAMVALMHNLVHVAPGPFAMVYSDAWSQEVTTLTEPNSVYFRGESIQFGVSEPEVAAPEEPALPTFIELDNS